MEQKTLICKQIFLLNMLKASRSFFLKRFIFNDDVKPKGQSTSTFSTIQFVPKTTRIVDLKSYPERETPTTYPF